MALTNFTPYDDDDDTTKDSSVSSQGREQEGGTRQDSWEIIDESDAVSQEDRQLILVEEVLGSENGADGCDTTSTEAIPAVPSRSDEALNGAGAVDTTDEAATETQAVDSNHEGQEQDESFPAVTTVENLDLSNESNLHDDVQISVDETSGEEKYDASSEVPANEASVETVKIKNPEGPSQRDEFMHTEAVKAEDTNAVLDKDSANESPYDCPALKSDESLDELEMPSTTDETSDDPNLSMLLSMGFDFQQSKLALAANGGNLEKAVECLLAGDYNNHSNDGPDKAFEYERKIDEAMMYDSSDPWFEISGNQGMDGDYVPIPNANTQQSQQQREQQHNGTWNFLESTLQDLDNRHQLRQRTKRSITNLHQSARHLWTDITNQTQSLRSNLQSTCDDADALARHRARSISHAASSAKDSMCRANSEYKIAEKVAAVAVVGGATLIALGNPRMGAGALAAAGATLAVGEVLKAEEERGSCCTFTRDIGLREGVHID